MTTITTAQIRSYLDNVSSFVMYEGDTDDFVRDMALAILNALRADENKKPLKRVPASEIDGLQDLLDAALGDDEEQEDRGSVVPSKYKAIYRERGDATTCGDWLATTINGYCKPRKRQFLLDLFVAIAEANGVDPAPYMRSETRGWQGRMRMTVRNKLAKMVAVSGVLIIPDVVTGDKGIELKAPKAWLSANARLVEASA